MSLFKELFGDLFNDRRDELAFDYSRAAEVEHDMTRMRVRDRAETLAAKPEAAAAEIARLQEKLNRVELVVSALISMARDKWSVTNDELLLAIARADAADGASDGKIADGNITCPTCRKPNSAKRGPCVFCGAELG